MKKLIPFSNSTEAEIWLFKNCESCKTSRNCSAKNNIELGFVTGDITKNAANFIGIEYIIYGYCKLKDICNFKDKREINKKTKSDNLTIF